MKHLILLNDPPHGPERSFNGLRMAQALAKNDPGSRRTPDSTPGGLAG